MDECKARERTVSDLKKIALEVRKDVVRMAGVARLHCGGVSLALVDLLVCLYWKRMNVSPEDRNWAARDRLVLNDASAVSALYACLARRGFFDREELWSYRRLGAMLQGYPDIRTPGVDAPGGANGLGIACGMCLALKAAKDPRPDVYCIIGQNELSDGAAWESASAAVSLGADKLTLIINSIHGGMDEYADRFRSFGWSVITANGHDFESMEAAFSASLSESALRPAVIIVRTEPESLGSSEEDKSMSQGDAEVVISRLDTASIGTL
ncbi:transketolase [Synergistales bacterium]|nr:transketolase [Synergistales bacterium]